MVKRFVRLVRFVFVFLLNTNDTNQTNKYGTDKSRTKN